MILATFLLLRLMLQQLLVASCDAYKQTTPSGKSPWQ